VIAPILGRVEAEHLELCGLYVTACPTVSVLPSLAPDYGVDHLMDLAGRMNFPWLMSNVYWEKSGQLLAGGLRKHVISWRGRKVRRIITSGVRGGACEDEEEEHGRRGIRQWG